MPFELSRSVQVTRDKEGRIQHLVHLQRPYVSAGETRGTARELANDYLWAVAAHFAIPPKWLAGLDRDPLQPLGFIPSPRAERVLVPDAGAAPHRVKAWERERRQRISAGLDEGPLLRFASEKEQAGTRTVSYVQTHRGFPVWQAGFSLVVQAAPLRVTASHSTLHLEPRTRPDPREAPKDFLEWLVPSPGTPETLHRRLAEELRADPASLRVNAWTPWLYHHEEPRLPRERQSWEWFGLPESSPAKLPFGWHYLALEILFTTAGEKTPAGLSWRAFLEAQSGRLLSLEGLFARAVPPGTPITGKIYRTDPLSASGDPNLTHSAPLADLNRMRDSVRLEGLLSPSPGTAQGLHGSFVTLSPQPPNPVAPPTDGTGSFDYDVTTPDFAAVNAYHHGDAFFRLIDALGFNTSSYFDGTNFPVAILHWPNPQAAGALLASNGTSDGCDRFEFGLVESKASVGSAVDGRVVAHEFAHAVLIDNIHHLHLGFAHSFGDSLAAIHFDPESQAPNRSLTFPWIPGVLREHQRDVRGGWSWGGSQDDGDYKSEQILSTTLFRLYLCLGGGAIKRIDRRPAADHVLYLIFRAVGTLPRHTVTPTDAVAFAAALMDADIGTQSFQGQPGGTVHKVVRWCFEQQGLYRSPNKLSTNTAGDPPDVDVYLEDVRKGGYEYTAHRPVPQGVWNRRQRDGRRGDQSPLIGQTNFLYVEVHNRGTQDATSVTVTVYQSLPGSNLNALEWPRDWQPLNKGDVLPTPIKSGKQALADPIPWQPAGTGPLALLVRVDADGDPSNIDPQTYLPCAAGPTAVDKLVRGDNNLGLLFVTPAP